MRQNKKGLSIVLFALIAVIVLGVGYAAVNAINLTINGNATATPQQENFSVKFRNEGSDTTSENAGNITVSDLSASFDTVGLTKAGDKSTVTYTVKNLSPDLKANITLSCDPQSGYNTEYFNNPVCRFGNGEQEIQLEAGGITTVTVEVEVKKTPILTDQTTQVVANLEATPRN